VKNPPGLKGGKQQHEAAMRDFDRVLSQLGKELAEEEIEKRVPLMPAPCLIEPFLLGYGDEVFTESASVDELTSLIKSLKKEEDAGDLYRRRALARIAAKQYDSVLDDATEAVRLLKTADPVDKNALADALSLQVSIHPRSFVQTLFHLITEHIIAPSPITPIAELRYQ
jgi:hypothetical protein